MIYSPEKVHWRATKAYYLRIHDGKTYREIGKIIGRYDDFSIPVSAERARQMASMGGRILRRQIRSACRQSHSNR